MTISLLGNLVTETDARLPIFSKINWLGKQVLALGKTLYSQLANITNLFYHAIKTHSKGCIIALTAITVSTAIYHNKKLLTIFLKFFHQQRTEVLSKQLFKELEETQKLLSHLRKGIMLLETNISIIDEYQETLIEKSNEIKDEFIAIETHLTQEIAQPKSCYIRQRKRISSLQNLGTRIRNLTMKVQTLSENTNTVKESYHQLSNPLIF